MIIFYCFELQFSFRRKQLKIIYVSKDLLHAHNRRQDDELLTRNEEEVKKKEEDRLTRRENNQERRTDDIDKLSTRDEEKVKNKEEDRLQRRENNQERRTDDIDKLSTRDEEKVKNKEEDRFKSREKILIKRIEDTEELLTRREEEKLKRREENQRKSTKYIGQNIENFIVRGSMHQGHSTFPISSRGKQCTAMAVAGIAMNALCHPIQWTSRTIDEILIAGDELFHESIKRRNDVSSGEMNARFLTAEEVHQNLTMSGSICQVMLGEITYGHLHNDLAEAGMPNLANLLSHVDESHTSGILTCNGISVGIISTNDIIGVFDSHSRGSNGKVSSDGTACFISVSNTEELLDVLLSNIPRVQLNGYEDQYQFTAIEITVNTRNQNVVEDTSVYELEYGLNTCSINEDNATASTASTVGENEEESARPELSSMETEEDRSVTNNVSFIHDDQYEEIQNFPLECETSSLNEGVENTNKNENMFVNFAWVWSELHKIYDNHGSLFGCTFANMKLVNIHHAGMKQIFHFKCDMCGKIAKICNIPDRDEEMDLNVSVVLGAQSIGIGFSQVEEFLGICNVRSMSYNTWQRAQTAAVRCAKEAEQIQMDDAAAEEARIAIEKGNVVNGIPFIAVEGDGSYQTRAYFYGRFDSASACFVIIGQETKNVLDIITKQKTCATCDHGSSIQPRPHKCYRNHGRNESSISMESAAASEAFGRSIIKY